MSLFRRPGRVYALAGRSDASQAASSSESASSSGSATRITDITAVPELNYDRVKKKIYVTERDSRSLPYTVIAVPMINPAAPW